jgi:hypothetical protein
MPSDKSHDTSPSDIASDSGLQSRATSVPLTPLTEFDLPAVPQPLAKAKDVQGTISPSPATARLIRPSHQVGIQYELIALGDRRTMLANETLCYELDMEAFFSAVLSFLPNPSDEDVNIIRAILVKNKVLGVTGWYGLIKKIPEGTSEHTAYDLPLAKVINAILFATPGTLAGKLKEDDDMYSPKASARVGAWNRSGATRAFISEGDHAWVSERPDSGKSDGGLPLLGNHRKSAASKDIEQLHTEDITLAAEYKVIDNQVR